MIDKRSEHLLEEASLKFTDFLEKNSYRKTPERYAVLKEIYSRDDHFEADTLFHDIKKNDFNISRATVYNTLDLLVNCELVRKHQFGRGHALYEKSYAYKQHDHLICMDCNKVIEFCDPRIQQIKSTMGELLDFKINYHSLNLYGSCQNLECESRPAKKEHGHEHYD